ncbi:hypothetical protein ABZP36_028247 [Zizania latifolia]
MAATSSAALLSLAFPATNATASASSFRPKADAHGPYPVDRAAAASCKKLLRDVMLENKIELYAPYVTVRRPHLSRLKILLCLSLVTCQIIDGKELLNERTNTENRYLKKVASIRFQLANAVSGLQCS